MRIEHWWFTAPLRLRSIFRRRQVEQELDEELQFHLEHKIEEGIAEGLSPEEARHRAMRAMGGLEQRKEEMRDMRRIHWLTDFVDDVRYAIRSLRRTPGLAAFVVITLALGIGMTATPFSMLDALIFRPYPVPHPRRRRHAGEHVTRQRLRLFLLSRVPRHPRPHEELRRRDRERAAADRRLQRRSREPRRGSKGGMMVSGNYFRVLGVEPQLGRGFREDEDEVPGRDAVVVLGPDFWKHEFASDPSVVGRTVRLNGTDFTVIGVAPESFPGMLHLRPSRLLHAAGDGAGVLDQPAEELLRGPGRSRADREGAPEAGHDAAAGAQRARRARAGLRARVSEAQSRPRRGGTHPFEMRTQATTSTGSSA